MCMCDVKFPATSAFNFLEEIKSQFLKTFGPLDLDNAYSYSLNTSFSKEIKHKMERYNKNHEYNGDSLAKLKKGVMDQSALLLQTNELMTQRGEKINLVVKKAETLKRESENYYSNAKKIRSMVRMRRLKILIFMLVSALFLLYVFSIAACGGFRWQNCREE